MLWFVWPTDYVDEGSVVVEAHDAEAALVSVAGCGSEADGYSVREVTLADVQRFQELVEAGTASLRDSAARIAELEAERDRLRSRLHKALDLETRAPGCQCDIEIGDSDCPVHPTCETCEVAGQAAVGVCPQCNSPLPTPPR